MSSSSSQEELSQFTRSPIKNSDKKAPSTLTFPSTNSNLNDKEALIDKFQEKMGDMLECQKELCTVKTQLGKIINESKQTEFRYKQLLIEKEAKIEEAFKRIQELELDNNTHQQNEISNCSKATKWKTRFRNQQETINQQNIALQQKDEQIEKLLQERRESNDQFKSEISDLQKKLDFKISEASDMKVELAEIKQQSVISSGSFSQQQKQLEEVVLTNEKLENQNNKLKETKEQLKMQLKQSSDESVIIQATISDQQQLILKLRKEKAKYKATCADLIKMQDELQKKIDHYSQFPEKIQEHERNFADLQKSYQRELKKTSNATNLLSMITALVGEAYKPKDILMNVQKVCQERDNLHKKLADNQKCIEYINQLETENKQSKEKINSFYQQFNAQKLRNAAIVSIEKARKSTNDQLIMLANNFGYGRDSIPFRSIIVTIIMSNRLQKILFSQPKTVDYVKDNRNWWWLSTDNASKISSLLIDSAVSFKNYQDQDETIKNSNSQMKNKIDEIEKELNEKNKLLEEKNQSQLLLRKEIHRLNEELSTLIDSETYINLENSFILAKKQLKALEKKEQQLNDEKTSLTEKVEEFTITSQDQQNEIAVLQEELEVAQTKIQKLIEDIRILEKSHIAKNKELLSLERGINKVKTTNDRNTAQFKALAMENQQLFNKLNPSKLCTIQEVTMQSSRLGLKSTKTLL